jgi:DNA-binding PadR family transcriptional regulator
MKSSPSKYEVELVRGNIGCLLLFLIKEEGNAYGYQLIKEVKKRSEGYFQFKEGTVYPALHRLENEGLVQGKWVKQQNGQERRYYRITKKGLETLKERMSVWQDFTAAMNLIIGPAEAKVAI